MNTTDFDDIEHQKENIEPVREGRSAASLAKTFAQNPLDARTANGAIRQEFEERIAASAELDDPIEPYLDYIKWINQEYPQGHTTDSGLIQLLELCTSDFKDAPFYKDDSRYLHVWIQYLKFSDAPKEVFMYLLGKNIGSGLATFYEEYAAYLESVGRSSQADEIYQLGIQSNARPIERLKRRYREFQERLEANPSSSNAGEPSSPVLPSMRPALAQKGAAPGLGVSSDGSELHQSGEDQREEKRKLQVFTDQNGDAAGGAASSGLGNNWDSIGSLASRRKENTMEAKPWIGEKLKQSSDTKAAKTLSVFRDAPQQGGQTLGNKRAENIAVAMDFINVDGEEFCLEEVLARSRKIYHSIYSRPEQQDQADSTVPLKGGGMFFFFISLFIFLRKSNSFMSMSRYYALSLVANRVITGPVTEKAC